MKQFFATKEYLKYQVNARFGTSTHSPFVYELAKNVLSKAKTTKDLTVAYRRALLREKNFLDKTDLGTGHSGLVQTNRLAKSSSIRAKYGKLLQSLVAYHQPAQILELGTCLGVSSLYLLHGYPHAQLQSVEGCPATFAKRANMYAQLNLPIERARFINSDFDSFLDNFSQDVDFVFIDGNHSFEATTRYFAKLWPLLSENGLIVLDDIHWSPQMQQAWTQIQADYQSLITIDLYQFGLCYKRSYQQKEHFILRY
ncbi:hypothetical protein GC194_05450 [bacterium]|nr:hypothetical protein [bacterium]